MKKILSIALILAILPSCSLITPTETPTDTPKETPQKEEITTDIKPTIIKIAEANSFAEYKEDNISYNPSLTPYTVDFKKILENPNLYISPEVEEMLKENYFAIATQDYRDEYYEIYETNRYEIIPNFITTDSALHTYHLFFAHLLKDLEKKELTNALNEFSEKMIEASLKQIEETEGTFAETLAKKNLAYFVVAKKLSDEEYKIPELVKEIVEAELLLIEKAEGIQKSNIIGTDEDPYNEDYSQYIARGHYTTDERLTKYFKSMMWYGRMTFRLSNIDETTQAILITSAVGTNKDLETLWNKIFEPINFFVGEADDLTFFDYSQLANSIFENLTLQEVLKKGEEGIKEFMVSGQFLPNPKINSMPVWAPFFIENDRNEEIKGFRVFGQRSTIDAQIFQNLIYRDVLEDDKGNLRMLPKSIDVPAVLGLKVAKEILENEGDFKFKKYPENFEKLEKLIASQTVKEWGQNLYWGWIYSLKAFNKDYTEGYPSFMLTKNWKLKELLTFLGSYTELKHDTVLYAKQVYAEMGGGPEIIEIDDRGYVEPNPELYNRLKSLVRLTIEGLAQRDMLSDTNKENLKRLEEMMKILRDISIKQLENKKLTDEEYEFIRNYGGSLEHMFAETLSDEDKAKDRKEVLNGHPSSIVTDIATDPNGTVLQVGVGPVQKIYVVFEIDGVQKIGVGGVFSHYEFPWPLEDRLTDEKWRSILFPYEPPNFEPLYDFVPEIADWQKSFSIIYNN